MKSKINYIETCTIVNANQSKTYTPSATVVRGYKFTEDGVQYDDDSYRTYYHVTPSTLVRLMIAQLRLLEVEKGIAHTEPAEREPTF